jgi:hypothetical protein
VGDKHDILNIGRIHRKIVEGETIEVTLEVVQDTETVHIEEGNEFATFLTRYDLWGSKQ